MFETQPPLQHTRSSGQENSSSQSVAGGRVSVNDRVSRRGGYRDEKVLKMRNDEMSLEKRQPGRLTNSYRENATAS